MRAEFIVKTRSLAGSSDLTLLAPIKPGLVPSLESVSYKTRVKRLLETLNGARSSSHEYALLRPISDAVERVGKIHSVRVAVLEPEDKVLLAVTFDGGWENYIRVLWQKVGTLLDVIFCNTVGYVSAYDHTFEEWVEWANRVQIETAFFYGTPEFTVDDVKYLQTEECLHREGPGLKDTDLLATRQAVLSAERLAWNAAKAGQGDPPQTIIEAAMQGLQALAVLYRLADFYVPTEEDGKYLHRAARDLLLEFLLVIKTPSLLKDARKRFGRQLDWLLVPVPARATPQLPANTPSYDRSEVQGGIVRDYKGISHGCLLLIGFDDPGTAAAFLGRLIPKVTTDDQSLAPGQLVTNIAFTYEGLRAVGLTETQLAWFPQEFREGMEARASVLGDLRINHPRRWHLPTLNAPKPVNGEPAHVELSAVHVVLQLRAGSNSTRARQIIDPEPAIAREVKELLDGLSGVRLLAVEPMRQYRNAQGQAVEHFGFVDGVSQPSIDPPKSGVTTYPNQVQLGELLLGYANAADQKPDPENSEDPVAARERLDFMRNGSFLVIRKLKQDVEALREAVDAARQATGLGPELVYAKMVGRWRNGDPLVAPGSGNDFDYEGDQQGRMCPFQAHIRRANPRSAIPLFHEAPGARAPRIARRGMSYGPRYIEPSSGKADDLVNEEERGLLFMAYNASIGEQYEVVQRWINGGNSGGALSGQSDPLLGVAKNGQKRYMRFEYDDMQHGEFVFSIALDGSDLPLGDPKPFVRLEWGAYLFTPSIRALWKLKNAAECGNSPVAPVWSSSAGQRLIEGLQSLERDRGPREAAAAWKNILEDPEAHKKFISASVWAAIRKYHDGVLRTPYGVLVADRDRVMKVFTDQEGNYSVCGYHDRMVRSIGEIFLGLDRLSKGGPYDQQSEATRAAIGKISEQEAFDLTRSQASHILSDFISEEMKVPSPSDPGRWELNLEVKEVLDKVLAFLCESWFGMPGTGKRLEAGGSRWDWKPGDRPLYPGNFTAPSRYIFQPRPGKTVVDFGCEYGSTLTEALREFVRDHRKAGTRPTARIGEAIFGKFDDPARDDEVARTMVGAMMGFLPTVDGNLRLSLNEWLRDGTFWSLRAAMAAPNPANPEPYTKAIALLRTPLINAMQLRPSPELVWRTAKCAHSIGKVPVDPDDIVVLSIVSATQQCLERGDPDIYPIFGGHRSSPQSCPVHACPGYGAGMGVILGVLSALLEVKESMRPSPVPLAFTFEGPRLPESPTELLY
jgi:Dyp-type peroxidase family